MSGTSKTARAAMKAGAGSAKAEVLSDAILVKQFREDRAAGIWPALPKSDALLREHDAWNEHYQEVTLEAANVRQALGIHGRGIETIDAINKCLRDLAIQAEANQVAAQEILRLGRELVLAESKNETYKKALLDVEAINLMQADCNTGK